MKLLTIILISFLLTCTKEYSGEGTPVPVDTIPIVDTPKNYFVNYDIYVPDNLKISHIEVKAKAQSDSIFISFASIIHMDDSVTWRYKETFDVTDEMSEDTVYFGYVKVYPGPVITKTFVTDTIIK